MDVRRFIAQTNRYTAAVRKLLSFKGEGVDVTYGIHIEDERLEHSYIKGERIFGTYQEVTSAAGTLSFVGVNNPASSGILVVITSIVAEVTTAAVVDVKFNTFLLSVSQGSMFARDTRWGATATTAQLVATTAAAAGGNILLKSTLAANNPTDLVTDAGRIPGLVLAPNTSFHVNVDAVGVNTLKVGIYGYERSIESGELI